MLRRVVDCLSAFRIRVFSAIRHVVRIRGYRNCLLPIRVIRVIRVIRGLMFSSHRPERLNTRDKPAGIV